MAQWATDYAADIAAHMGEALLLVDGAFAVLEANKAAVAFAGGTDAESLRGQRMTGIEEDGTVRFDPAFLDPAGVPVDGRYRVESPWRAAINADVRFVPVKDDDKKTLVFLRESTSLEQFDQVFYQSEKLAAMDNIVAGIAHELNNPMTAILGYAELLLATEANPKRKHRIGLIAEEADRCGKIIGNMLSFTRSFGNDFEEANAGALLEEVVSLRAYQMRVDGIDIDIDISRTIPSGLMQPSAIRRLFLNILHNAHQALLEVPPERRHFWASAHYRDETVCLEIADSGPGIAEEVRYKIFDPFFTTRALGEGMGLGLSVAYGVVHEHHGKIWMEPRKGGGTSIKIELPVRMVE